jgi:hypothetical protein
MARSHRWLAWIEDVPREYSPVKGGENYVVCPEI